MAHWLARLRGCPKCGLAFSTLLHPFCQNDGCPVRVWTRMLGGDELSDQDRELDAAWRREVEASGALDTSRDDTERE